MCFPFLLMVAMFPSICGMLSCDWIIEDVLDPVLIPDWMIDEVLDPVGALLPPCD